MVARLKVNEERGTSCLFARSPQSKNFSVVKRIVAVKPLAN
jgi:hypothetical protein